MDLEIALPNYKVGLGPGPIKTQVGPKAQSVFELFKFVLSQQDGLGLNHLTLGYTPRPIQNN